MYVKRNESGQVLPIVALMMVALLGMAALAIDGSNLYSQHRRMQADIDVAVKVAAAKMFDINATDGVTYTIEAANAITSAAQLLAQNGYPNNLAAASVPSTFPDTSGFFTKNGITICGANTDTSSIKITICTPPITASSPFVGRPYYLEGFLARNVPGFFGGVIGLSKARLGVRALAWTGGVSQPFAIIGLDTTTSDCGIVVASTGANLTTSPGSIHSNTQTCVKNGTASIDGTTESVITTTTSNGSPITGSAGTTNGGASLISNPYTATLPGPTSPVTHAITMCASGCTYTRFNTLPAGSYLQACASNYHAFGLGDAPGSNVTWVFPPDDPSAVSVTLPGVTNPVTTGNPGLVDNADYSNGEYDFYPHCDNPDPAKATPGIYYFSRNPTDLKTSGSTTINSYNSVFVLNPSNTLIEQSGTTLWGLSGATSGPYQGMAIYENTPCTPTQTMKLNGSSGSSIVGIVDASCANVDVTGNVTNSPFVTGVLVGWQVTVSGNGEAVVSYDPTAAPATNGSVLVDGG